MKRVRVIQGSDTVDECISRLIQRVESHDPVAASAAVANRQRPRDRLASRSPGTQHREAENFSRWLAWIDANGEPVSPIEPNSIRAHLLAFAEAGAAPATVMNRLSSIGRLCDDLGWSTPDLKRELQGVWLALKATVRARERTPLPPDFLDRLERVTDASDPRQVAETALVFLIAQAFVRPHELSGWSPVREFPRPHLRVSDVTMQPDGSGLVRIPGYGVVRPKTALAKIPPRAMRWVSRALASAASPDEALFKPLWEKNRKYRSLQSQELQLLLRRIGGRLQCPELSVYALRQHGAAQLLAAGVALASVRGGVRRLAHPRRVAAWASHTPSATGGNGACRSGPAEQAQLF